MSSDPPLTVQALDESLKDLVNWERVALHLPEMNQPQIDVIIKDNPGNTAKQKCALYDTWLQVYPNGTWNNVIQALENANQNNFAQRIQQKLVIKKREGGSNIEKLTEQIDEGVVTELRRLHKTFERLEKDVEKRCNEVVASNKISFKDFSRLFTRSQYKISSLKNVQTTDQLFESLSCHYTFLDCDLLERVVEQLPDSTDLLSTVHDHKKNISNFKRKHLFEI